MIPGFAAMALTAGLSFGAPYHVVTPRPDALPVLFDAALADAGPLPCQVEVFVQGDQSYAASDGMGYCGITFDTDMWDPDDMSWWAPYTVRHEIAHVLTFDEFEAHGPRFRAVEALLLEPLQIVLIYGANEYPDEIWLCGIRVQ